MKTTVNQRFETMIKSLGLTKNAFAKALGVASTQIYNCINGRNAPSFDLLSKIAITFPTVNMSWLLTGKGQVLSTKPENLDESVNMLGKIKEIEDQVQLLSANLKKNDGVSEEKVMEIMRKAFMLKK